VLRLQFWLAEYLGFGWIQLGLNGTPQGGVGELLRLLALREPSESLCRCDGYLPSTAAFAFLLDAA